MKLLLLLLSAFLLAGCQLNPLVSPSSNNNNYQTNPSPTMTPVTTPTATPSPEISSATAIFKTSLGDITIELYPKSAPKTVANFIGLAKGTREWIDPKTGQKVSDKSLYSGTIFHRVIPDFMIQGGDPLGSGMGGPGYKFADEFDPNLNFSEPYMLAMANSGANTNGSQFFITVAPTTWLNNKHTIFGKVTSGQAVVDRIATTKTLPGDKPVIDIVLTGIEITEK